MPGSPPRIRKNSGAITPSEVDSASDSIAARDTPGFVQRLRIAADDVADGGTALRQRTRQRGADGLHRVAERLLGE